MIQVARTPKPDILERRGEQWRDDYIAAIAAQGAHPTAEARQTKKATEKKYGHRDIKTALKTMFSNKCAYCESHIAHVSYGDIEHYAPKSKFPERCFDWDNLLLAWGVCNGSAHKGDKFPTAEEGGPLVNPVQEDPDDFFDFEYDPDTGTANVIPRDAPRAYATEQVLSLNRPDLVRHRSDVVEMMAIIAILAKKGDASAAAKLAQCCDQKGEYAAFARALYRRFVP